MEKQPKTRKAAPATEGVEVDGVAGGRMGMNNEGQMSKKTIAAVVFVVAVIAVAAYSTKGNLMPSNSNTYQAVFLNNGQTYFGKLSREESIYPTLRDVYYLQITQSPQPMKAGETAPTNINLVKLGSELHGPADEMRINRDQILFIEDLKSDSKVLQAILESKKSK